GLVQSPHTAGPARRPIRSREVTNVTTKLLESRTAIVTGAGRGIGRGIALCLAREGANVVVADFAAEGLGPVGKEVEALGVGALGVQVDVRDEVDVDRMVGAAVERFGRLDILVNNAGVWVIKPLMELTPEEYDRQLDTNLRGMFLACRRAVPALIAAGGG